MNSDAKYLGINQTKPFFGCIELFLDGRSITTDEDHFMRHYINSATHKRLSLECLNTVRSFNITQSLLYGIFCIH